MAETVRMALVDLARKVEEQRDVWHPAGGRSGTDAGADGERSQPAMPGP
jgi:hypothetical protein